MMMMIFIMKMMERVMVLCNDDGVSEEKNGKVWMAK